MRRSIVVVVVLLLLAPDGALAKSSPPPNKGTTTASKKTRRAQASKKRHAKAKRRKPRRRRRPAARCRDIFCTAQVVRLDGSGKDNRALSQQQVEKTMQAHHKRIETCLVQARRRDPSMVKALIEFVVHRGGRVLASRVNGKRYSPLARCVHRKMRAVRFPRTSVLRTVASFTIVIPH